MHYCTYEDSLGMLHTPSPAPNHLGSLILCFLVSASSAAGPSNRLAADRIGHHNVKGSIFHSLSIEDKLALGQVSDSTLTPR